VTQKPTTPPVRALIDKSEIDDDALDAIVGGRGVAPVVQGGADSWSLAVADLALVIAADGTTPEREGAAKPAAAVPSASEPSLKRALLPEQSGEASPPDKASPVVGANMGDDVSALFNPTGPRKET
jgi:hypothetical protein